MDVSYSQEAGRFVSADLQRLAEIIADYDPYLQLCWVPPENRTSADDRPYLIVHNPPGKPVYPVMFFSDLDRPVDILGRLLAGDSNHNDVLANLEAREAAEKLMQHKKHLDELAESADMMHFLMTNRSKNWVNWKDRKTGENVKLDSTRRRVT